MSGLNSLGKKWESHILFRDRICSSNIHSCKLGFRFISGSNSSKCLNENHCCQLNTLANTSVLSTVFQALLIYSFQHLEAENSYPVHTLNFCIIQNIFSHLFILYIIGPKRIINCSIKYFLSDLNLYTFS